MSAFKAENSVEILPDPRTIKCFCCDLNWARFDRPFPSTTAAMASDWHAVDAKEYFDWHVEFGCNVIFCQAYLFGGTALYPSRLGPLAPSNGSTLLPRLYEMSRDAKMPFVSYFCAGADLTVAGWWVSRQKRRYRNRMCSYCCRTKRGKSSRSRISFHRGKCTG